MLGIGVLAAASLVGGLSGSLGILIAAGAGQAFGAVLVAPNALAILSRGRASIALARTETQISNRASR